VATNLARVYQHISEYPLSRPVKFADISSTLTALIPKLQLRHVNSIINMHTRSYKKTGSAPNMKSVINSFP